MAFDWKTLVKTVAPTVASAFGTPIAGMGVSALLNALLPDGAPKPDDPEAYISQALATATPDTLLKIKQADQAFAVQMKQLDIDLEKLQVEATQKSRESAQDLKKTWLQSNKWDYEPVLAILVVCSFFGAEGWVFWIASHPETVKMTTDVSILVGRILGTVDAAFMLLLSFRWGTSYSSGQKNATIDKALSAATNGNGNGNGNGTAKH